MQDSSNHMIDARRSAGSARTALRLTGFGRATLRLAAAIAFAAAAPAPAAPPTVTPTVAVDVGHTLAASGARSARGRTEFEFNRDLGLRVLSALERLGVTTRVVNLDGRIGSLAERPAQVPDADFFLSIHHDSVSESELEFWSGTDGPKATATAGRPFAVRVTAQLGPRAQRIVRERDRRTFAARRLRADAQERPPPRDYADRRHAVHYYDDLVVLYRALQPAVLFEAGVIKHRDEELLLRDPQRQSLMAGEIATGIAACMMAGR